MKIIPERSNSYIYGASHYLENFKHTFRSRN